MPLEALFEAELRHQPDLEPLVPAQGRAGALVGSGDGTVDGEKLAGSLRWTLFEAPGELVCAMEPIAVIETGDGAQVRVEGRGYARRETREDRVWKVAATLCSRARTNGMRGSATRSPSGKASSTPMPTVRATAPSCKRPKTRRARERLGRRFVDARLDPRPTARTSAAPASVAR
jgi:hypothetical protein